MLEERTHREARRHTVWWRIARTVVLTLLPLIALSGCNDDTGVPDEVAQVELDAEERNPFGGDPAEFEGERVVLTAAIDEVIHPEVFLIGADDPNGDRYLIIHDGSMTVTQGDRVEVDGRVRDIDIFDLEEDLDVNLDMPTFEPYEGDYGIVAEKVEVLDG